MSNNANRAGRIGGKTMIAVYPKTYGRGAGDPLRRAFGNKLDRKDLVQ